MKSPLERVDELLLEKLSIAGLVADVHPWPADFPASFGATCALFREDNLAVLRGMIVANTQVNFCYIDPPYNTGSKFLYEDNRRGKSGGIWGSHEPWMTFMLPRLVCARELLKPSGIMAISIDDYAYPQLKVLMDLVFGEECSLGTLVVVRSRNGLGSNKNIADMHEYVLLYGRSDLARLRGIPENEDKNYPKSDSYGSFAVDGLFRKKGEDSRREDRPNMFYPLFVSGTGEVFTERTVPDQLEVFPRDSKGIDRRWLWGKEKADRDSWRLYGSSKGVIYVKNYKSTDKRIRLRSVLSKPEYLTDAATREIKEVFGGKIFDTPKPLSLLVDLLDCCCPEDGSVLDFFAGSGTTAEAVAVLNSSGKNSRNVILVEHEAEIPAGHPAYEMNLRTTADITEARLRHICQKYPAFSFQKLAA